MPPRPYISHQAKRGFWLLALAVFLCGLPRSMLAMLSVILAELGTSTEQIGLILASPIVPTLGCLLISGMLLEKYRAKSLILLGSAFMLVGFLSLEFSVHSNLGVALSLSCFGMGFGLFMSPAVIYSKNCLSAHRLVYLFGIFALMFPLPNAFGPFLAEIYLQHFGLSWFFVVNTLPLFVALLILFLLKNDLSGGEAEGSVNYWRLLVSPNLRLPFYGIFVVGLMFGIVPSFMALILTQNGVPVSYFFTTFTLAMLLSRFVIMRYVQQIPREFILMGGLGLMLFGHITITLGAPAWLVLGVSLLYGIGHSAAYPTLSVWCSSEFLPQNRGKPIALFNTVFSSGIYLTPLMGGVMIQHFGLLSLTIFLSLVCFSAMISFSVHFLKSRPF